MAKPVVVVYLDGGLVQRVIADAEVEVFVVDQDTEGGTSHPTYVESLEAFLQGYDVEIEPHEVFHIKKIWEVC